MLVAQASSVRFSHQPERWQSAQTGMCEKQPGQALKPRATQPKHDIDAAMCPYFTLFSSHSCFSTIFRCKIFDQWPTVCFIFYSETRRVGMRFSCQNWSLCPTTKWNLSISWDRALLLQSFWGSSKRDCVSKYHMVLLKLFISHILVVLPSKLLWLNVTMSQVNRLVGFVVKMGHSTRKNITQCTWRPHLSQKTDKSCKLCKVEPSAIWPFLFHFSCLRYTDTVRWLVCCLIWTKIYSGVHPGKKKKHDPEHEMASRYF